MISNDKQGMIRAIQKYNGGAAVITVSQFARFLGLTSSAKAKKKLEGLQAYEGKYYLVSDVADMWIRGLQ